MDELGEDDERGRSEKMEGGEEGGIKERLKRKIEIRIIKKEKRVIEENLKMEKEVVINRRGWKEIEGEGGKGEGGGIEVRNVEDGMEEKREIENEEVKKKIWKEWEMENIGNRKWEEGKKLGRIEEDSVEIEKGGRNIKWGNGNREIKGSYDEKKKKRIKSELEKDERKRGRKKIEGKEEEIEWKEIKNMDGEDGLEDELKKSFEILKRKEEEKIIIEGKNLIRSFEKDRMKIKNEGKRKGGERWFRRRNGWFGVLWSWKRIG